MGKGPCDKILQRENQGPTAGKSPQEKTRVLGEETAGEGEKRKKITHFGGERKTGGEGDQNPKKAGTRFGGQLEKRKIRTLHGGRVRKENRHTTTGFGGRARQRGFWDSGKKQKTGNTQRKGGQRNGGVLRIEGRSNPNTKTGGKKRRGRKAVGGVWGTEGVGIRSGKFRERNSIILSLRRTIIARLIGELFKLPDRSGKVPGKWGV